MPFSEKTKILLVDDRPENLISLGAILASSDYHLVMAESGNEALRKLLEEDFALILLDVQMPGMDGFETANLIKKREKSRHVPIIFVTALTPDAPFLFRGYSAGAVDYITKPFDPTILRSKVAVFADLYQKKRQLEKQADLIRENEKLEREQEVTRIELQSLKREQKVNDKYRDLVDGITDGIVWTADLPTMSLSFVSRQAERIMGLSGTSFEKELLTSPQVVDQRKKWISAIARGDVLTRDFSFEHKIICRSQRVRWFQSSLRLAKISEPENYEIRGLSVDITGLKQAEETAKAAIAVRDQFLSIASHELKTPLTPLCLQLEILQRMIASGSPPEQIIGKTKSYIDRLYRLTDRLSHLVNELLDVSRINNGKLHLERENISLSSLIQDLCERFAQGISRSGSSIHLNLTGEIVGVWDKLRIEQVVTNLLTNAIKYGEGKPIEVHTEVKGENAVISIRDYGIGISKEDQERVFQLYERAVSAAHFGGLGLGLFIVKQIVEAHGGSVEVESRFGEGSTFTVQIPLVCPVSVEEEQTPANGQCGDTDTGGNLQLLAH